MADTRRNKIAGAVTEMLPDPILVVDSDGQYVDCMGGSDRSLYHDGAFLIGKYMHDVMPKEMADRFLDLVRRTLNEGTLQIEEYELSADDLRFHGHEGQVERQWFLGRLAPLDLDDHDKPCVVWLAINITERKRIEQELQHRAFTDPLTGILNRGAFVEALERAGERFRRYGNPVCVGMFDLDFFKRVNDTYGHDVGDKVLINTTQKMAEIIRKPDSLGRWGGEEFCIVFTDVKEDEAVEAAERIRKAIEQMVINTDGASFSITISAGVSAMRPEDGSVFDAAKRADEALYAAKNSGRNKVCR